MKLLRIGDKGTEVARLQALLNTSGYALHTDGWFGSQTEQSVMAFQQQHGLLVDGIVGARTHAALGKFSEHPRSDKDITQQEIIAAAEQLDIEPAILMAFIDVETPSDEGFLATGQAIMLFERHKFYQFIDKELAKELSTSNPNICHAKPGGYRGGTREYSRFKDAAVHDRKAAIEASSWGLFQVMGYHWKRLGYDSAEDFYQQMQTSEARQLDAVVRFIKADELLLKALKAKRWITIAKRYNGPAYAKNRYDTKLKLAYAHYARLAGVEPALTNDDLLAALDLGGEDDQLAAV